MSHGDVNLLSLERLPPGQNVLVHAVDQRAVEIEQQPGPTAMLPEEFADLEPFAAAWCLPTEHERYARRLASSMDEMQALYDAITPRAKEATEYCNRFPLDSMPENVVNLMHLIYSMILVSFPVECWRQPRVPDSGAAAMDCLVEPVP